MSRRRKRQAQQLWIGPTIVCISLILVTLVVAWPALAPGNRDAPALPRLGELIPDMAGEPSRSKTAEVAYAELVGTWTGRGRDRQSDIDSTLVASLDRTLQLDLHVTKDGATVHRAAPIQVTAMRLEADELVLTVRIAGVRAATPLRFRLDGGTLRALFTGNDGSVTEIRYTRTD